MPRLSQESPPCPHCGGPTRPQPVYKHRWDCCARCGCATRVHGAPAFARSLPRGLAARLPGRLRPGDGDDPGIFFLGAAGTEAAARADQAEARRVEALLARLGVETDGAVLDIGGGRGAVVARLAGRARRAALTERAPELVAAAARAGLEAVTLDFDRESLEERIKGHFDLILIRYSLGWCRDLPRLLAGLTAVSAPGARLLLAFVVASRGAALCSALEDAAPWALWSPDCLAASVGRAGWRLVTRFEPDPPLPFWRPHRRGFAALSLPWALRGGPLPRGWEQRQAGLLFQREAA